MLIQSSNQFVTLIQNSRNDTYRNHNTFAEKKRGYEHPKYIVHKCATEKYCSNLAKNTMIKKNNI